MKERKPMNRTHVDIEKNSSDRLDRTEARDDLVLTGTGLDRLVAITLEDQGLNLRLGSNEIHDAVDAMNGMNRILIDAIQATGAGQDGRITAAHVYEMSDWISDHHLEDWIRLHGDDEAGVETGFHLVQNDGASSFLFGENAVNRIADGIYHIGLGHSRDRLINEDGQMNAQVDDVAFWLNGLLAEDLASGRFSAVESPAIATTGTGLDRLVEGILADEGLLDRIPLSEIREGAAAANEMNVIIVDSIRALGLANDGSLSSGDVFALADHIRENHADAFMLAHGDDEDGVETGFHLVQNDGAIETMFGENAVNTVSDGIYHLVFGYRGGNLINEDGNSNARIEEVAYWLDDLLAGDMASLENPATDPRPAGDTGTGLDRLVDIINEDAGLQNRLPIFEQVGGAAAANAMNHIIVDTIRDLGLAQTGELTVADVTRLSDHIREHYSESFMIAHGDDETGVETGFHLVQNDGAVTQLFGRNAVDSVSDGIYHLVFGYRGDRLVNEDGNANARLEEVASWLNALLEDDFAAISPPRPETEATGLDRILSIIEQDVELNRRVSGSEIEEGMDSARAMNDIILEAMQTTGSGANGRISAGDVAMISEWISENRVEDWIRHHGDDENGVETAFHLVQGDGSSSRLHGRSAIDTVADGIYHLGFGHDGTFLLNEDGNRNANLNDVAFWLQDLLQDDLDAGKLSGENDPYHVGSTGSGLDAIPDILMQDARLETLFSTADLHQAATAADGMNKILLQAIRETGSANDGRIGEADIGRIDVWIAENAKAEWDALNGDDARTADGFRMVQWEGSVSSLEGQNALDGIARMIYSLGNGVSSNAVHDIDGRWVARTSDVANALNRLLSDDLSEGSLRNPDALMDVGFSPAVSAEDAVQTRGNGLVGEAFDVARAWTHVEAMIDDIETGSLVATHRFETGSIAFGGRNTESLAQFIGSEGSVTAGDGAVEMQTMGMRLSGYIWLEPGEHEITVRSDDGFALRLRGEDVMRFSAPRGDAPTTETINVAGGLYDIEIFYFENYGDQSLSLWVDGSVVDDARLYRSLQDFEAAPEYHPLSSQVIDAGDAVQTSGNGLEGKVYAGLPYITDIQKLISAIESEAVALTHVVSAGDLDFRGAGVESLASFLGDNGDVASGDPDTGVERMGMHLEGYVWIDPGDHTLTVRSDDSFALRLGGEDILRHAGLRSEAATEITGTFTGGLYEIEIFYYENNGSQALHLMIDDETIGRDRLYRSISDFESAQPHVPVETGPEGSGTGLDAIIGWIQSDPGLIARTTESEREEGAMAASVMNDIILEGIKFLGLADDGEFTVSEIHDLASWIQDNRFEPWVAAHGDDEAGIETGFHLVQNDGDELRVFGVQAIDQVADGLYHLGFGYDGDRLINEDGARNARVEDVTSWLNALLEDDLENGSLATGLSDIVKGDTGTGLDGLISAVAEDPELTRRLPGEEIRLGADAMDTMNRIILDGIVENGFANDGKISAAEVAGLSDWIVEHHLETWTIAHGDDESGIETGFHLVQGDGAITRDHALNLVDQVADGLYHLGFGYKMGRLINEDGAGNASLKDVGYWLTDLLAADMADLENPGISPVSTGTTGTGLDALVAAIGADSALQDRLSLTEIRDGAAAADVMNGIIVEGIRELGYANDGTLTGAEIRGLADWVRINHAQAADSPWLIAHGDDETGIETGFHLVQNDGATSRIFAENLVDTVADGIYHLGFGYRGDRLINEDGNNNQKISDIASWMNQLFDAEDFSEMANPDVGIFGGSTGTGLDAWTHAIQTDAGLQQRISITEIDAGAHAADAMNAIIVKSITTLGIARDGAFTESDIRALSDHIRAHHLDEWIEAHGDDEDGVETGFHLVQNDGSLSRLYGESAIDAVFDGAYHLGFGHVDDRLVNEDGARNQRLADVAYWLEAALSEELRNGALVDETSADPYLTGTTGTGLDLLVQLITQDEVLNQRLDLSVIQSAAEAADGLNDLLVQAVKETGIAGKGYFTATDMKDLSDWLKKSHAEEWRDLNTDFMKAMPGDSSLFGVSAMRDVADAIYNIGFGWFDWGAVMTETGGSDHRLGTVAGWMNRLLADDIASGSLDADTLEALPEAALQSGPLDGPTSLVRPGEMPLSEATIVVSFRADSPSSGRDVLVSRDYGGIGEGEFTFSIVNGKLEFRFESDARTFVLSSGEIKILPGEDYTAAVSFSSESVDLHLNGEKVDMRSSLDIDWDAAPREMVAGGGTWSRGVWNQTRIGDVFDGEIRDVAIYDHMLDNREIAALNVSGDLPALDVGAAALTHGADLTLQGDGLVVAVHDLDENLSYVSDFVRSFMDAPPDAVFIAESFDFEGGSTLGHFLGSDTPDDVSDILAETFGLHADGFIFLEEGRHRLDVETDDGFRLSIGGEKVAAFEGLRSPGVSSVTIEAKETGFYDIDLLYFENTGQQVLKVSLDGEILDQGILFSELPHLSDTYLFL